MINTPERLRIPAITNDRVEVLCNWSSFAGKDYLKICLNDEEAIVPRSSFVRIAMMLATEEEQDKMIPTVEIPIRCYRKVVTIKLNKNMKIGEYLSIPVSFEVPLTSIGNSKEFLNIIK